MTRSMTPMAMLLPLVAMVVLMTLSSMLSVDGQTFPSSTLCDQDWHAVMTVNGSRDGTDFNEPAEEWSSFNTQQFRYSLPEHDFYDDMLHVGWGATISKSPLGEGYR